MVFLANHVYVIFPYLVTTDCFIFGCLGRILEFQEDMKRPRAALYITTISCIDPLTT